ncbi:hypothetical protein BDR05DRAFT_973668 [Suillus weaverae]|nr:hypothetical protein BDR05DRAFT_973668 [Suillus weaverae]
MLYLQSVGKSVCAQDIVDYLDRPENGVCLGIKKSISLRTAHRWMSRLGYHWKREPQGQYTDGHEREDVVLYRNNCYMRKWKIEDITIEDLSEVKSPGRCTVMWFHDKSTFYASDQRKMCWVHDSESSVPQQKGEGASLMVADFVSADYGWLRSRDGKESARVLFKAGRARDVYFTNQEIVAQPVKAMDILQKDYPDENHVLIFDNAMTHLKHANDALAARKMLKNPSQTFGPSASVKDANGKPVLGPDGKQLPNGDLQPLYFAQGHAKAGWFKEMAQILVEHGYLMYTQPDFAKVESNLEAMFFLLKFHCELNFIEQCWGCAKRLFFIRSSRFVDAYRKGLDGKQAAWAIKRYRRHRVLPESIMWELEQSQ